MSFGHDLARSLLALSFVACSLDAEGRGGFDGDLEEMEPDPILGEPDAGLDDAGELGRDAGTYEDAATAQPDASTELEPDAGAMPESDPREVLLGSYAGKRTFATIQVIDTPLFRNDVKVLTTSYSVAEIVRRNQRYFFRERQCRITVDSSGDFFTQIDVSLADAVPQSTGQTEKEVDVQLRDGQLRFERPLTHLAVGFRANGLGDALPTSADDPRVVDGDGDGHPGVTVRINARVGISVDGDAYVVQWNRVRYALVREDDGSLSGLNDDRTEQRVVGTSPGDDVLSAVEDQYADPDASQNRVHFVRLPEALDCASMLAREAALFPPAP